MADYNHDKGISTDPDVEAARDFAAKAESAVSETRAKMQEQIEHYEAKSESLRDQASIYADAARTLRQFVYGESEAVTPSKKTYRSDDNVPSGII